MIDPEKDISNLDFPVAGVILEALSGLSTEKRQELLNAQPEDDFVSARVDVYLHELEAAMHAGYGELGAKEIALKECLHGITGDDGEVLEA
jgi:hypothetical protein